MNRIFSFLTAALLLAGVAGQQAAAQSTTYGNEWIETGRTYYKFKVGAPGVYRISKAALDAVGLPGGTAGAAFKMFRNGVQVPLFVTTGSAFGSGDYIEFWGTGNDGTLDAQLYGTNVQPNDRQSLFTDTAAYFLTTDAAGGHRRFTDATTAIPGSPGAAVAYGWATVGQSFRGKWSPGKSQAGSCSPGGDYKFYSSQFDAAEGFLNDFLSPSATYSVNLSTPNAVSGLAPRMAAGVIGISFANDHLLKIHVNNTLVVDTTYGSWSAARFSAASSSTAALPSTTEVRFTATAGGSCFYDQWGVSFAELEYPRTFDYSGQTTARFALAPSATSQYLSVDFAYGGTAPRLYDLTNNTYYTADISTGPARFMLQPSLAGRTLVMWADGATAPLSVTKAVNFTAWGSPTQQGDYIIITHPSLHTPVGGTDPVDAYRAYRASATGGSYTPRVAEIDELYDAFAYGVDHHPMAVRRFLQYAYDTWTTVPPKYVFILGRGLVYHQYRNYLASPGSFNFPLVPTYGDPGSDIDFVNFGLNRSAALRIGRMNATNGEQIATYLQKVKDYEAALLSPALPTFESERWKKEVLHIAGASDRNLQLSSLIPTLDVGAAILRDTFTGDDVKLVAKNTTNPIDPVTTPYVDSLINSGNSMITFHGHAFASGFDYNINTPENYTNAPRLPVFLALGCNVSQMFELSNTKTISERYVEHGGGGAVAMIASDNLGFITFHRPYQVAFYNSRAFKHYGGTLGDHFLHAYNTLNGNDPYGNPFIFTHLEAHLLTGDPAIRLFAPQRPDYAIAANSLSTLPGAVSSALDSFSLRIQFHNLGKALRDTPLTVRVEHTAPGGTKVIKNTYTRVNVLHGDTTAVRIKLDKVKDIGLNRYTVTLDPEGRFDEVSEANNTASIDVFVFSNDLKPVWPREFSIVGTPTVTLKASSLNPFRKSAKFRMEMDTTEAFNSPLIQRYETTAPGGLLKWTPTATLRDSTVYYWRTALDSLVNGQYVWSNSSFVYHGGSTKNGWNQSHYFQYRKDNFNSTELSEDRNISFTRYNNKVTVKTRVMLTGADIDDNKIQINDVDRQRSHCANSHAGSLQIMVIDSLTGRPWQNTFDLASRFGHNTPGCGGTLLSRAQVVFEFQLGDKYQRDGARRFLDSIPAGNFVFIKNSILYRGFAGGSVLYVPHPAESWKADSVDFGGQSLYKSLKNYGFSTLDNYYKAQPFYFFFQKGVASWPVQQEVGADSTVKLVKDILLPARLGSGSVLSTTIGPAKSWNRLQWQASAADGQPENDTVTFRVWGMTEGGSPTLLLDKPVSVAAAGYSPGTEAAREDQLYYGTAVDTALDWVSATTYPYLRLEFIARDTVNRTAAQIKYWRVLYTGVPEGALAPAAYYTLGDSLQVGQTQEFGVAFENVSDQPMDSVLVRYNVVDRSGVTNLMGRQRYRPLPPGDTLHAKISFDPARFLGSNLLFVEANPFNDQPEQYHPNNLGYVPFRIAGDDSNPLLDVTFDGVHILDRDIVSSKPFIKVMLKDENKFLALQDTGLLRVYMRYPNDPIGTRRLVPFDGTVCRFVPADMSNGQANAAYIEYRPHLSEKSADSRQHIYELAVAAQDVTGNSSGPEFRISFEVIHEASVTKVLNYPNPFSTATAFVFTLTGSEIPQQFKIQIMTVTGKVVREITKAELGPLRIGRNITDYKWDGRDQYGQLLGNGVYLYRVVTTLNGKDMDAFNPGAESSRDGAGASVDRFFNKGWGKMYIMR